MEREGVYRGRSNISACNESQEHGPFCLINGSIRSVLGSLLIFCHCQAIAENWT
uniref:Uncharacterized protein n=1 Tax=Arundo donax TaxID=35708 RepID=A0A0A9GYB0_ARUDO